MPQIPDLINLAIPGFIALLLLEVVLDAVMRRDLYQFKDTAASLAMGTGSVLLGAASKALAFAAYTAVHRFAIFNIGYQWWAWAILFFAEDLTYYWFHRTSHECRLFWASHVVHHSSQRYNLGTALRQTWTGFFMSFIFWLWLPLVGFPPIMVMTMQAVSLLYQFWVHTELVRRLGPLEWVMNTPSHHRVHHGSNQRYLDRNHGSILIVWDRLFGTFEREDPDEPPVYGLTKNIHTFDPVRVMTHEHRAMLRDVARSRSWPERLGRLLRGPAWSPDRVGVAGGGQARS